MRPDPQRYGQIQQALTDRGYYHGAADGVWNDESTNALKHFQADQEFDADGKIDALTLTRLGLGPKHDGSSASTVSLTAASSSSEFPPETVLPLDRTLPEAPPPVSDPE